MYQFLSEELVSNNIVSHAITLYVNDDISMKTWFHLGFGLRLVDSVKEINQFTSPVVSKDVHIQPITKHNLQAFLSLQKKLHFYFKNAPLFMPQTDEDERHKLLEFMHQEEHYLYGLYQESVPTALMKLKPIGENIFTSDKNSIHICGLYVDENVRSRGLATLFLEYVEHQCHLKGYTLIGVDFESFSIKGSNFWNRHFTPDTYTLTRRIDENILKRY